MKYYFCVIYCIWPSDLLCYFFTVQMLLVLRTEVTRVFVLRLCALVHTATTDLVNEEDWIPVATVERGGSPFAISSIPLRFRDMLESAMEYLTE